MPKVTHSGFKREFCSGWRKKNPLTYFGLNVNFAVADAKTPNPFGLKREFCSGDAKKNPLLILALHVNLAVPDAKKKPILA